MLLASSYYYTEGDLTVAGKKTLLTLSNIVFAVALAVAVYAMINIYLSRQNLPPGVCPVDNNQLVLYFAIGMSIVSLIFSYLGDKRIKK